MGNFNNYNQEKLIELKEQMAIAEAEADKYFSGNDAAKHEIKQSLRANPDYRTVIAEWD
ncbi:hypothetical protein [Pedobacter panaciterrae]